MSHKQTQNSFKNCKSFKGLMNHLTVTHLPPSTIQAETITNKLEQ